MCSHHIIEVSTAGDPPAELHSRVLKLCKENDLDLKGWPARKLQPLSLYSLCQFAAKLWKDSLYLSTTTQLYWSQLQSSSYNTCLRFCKPHILWNSTFLDFQFSKQENFHSVSTLQHLQWISDLHHQPASVLLVINRPSISSVQHSLIFLFLLC